MGLSEILSGKRDQWKMADKHPQVCWARMARVEKDTKGEILGGQIEVNRSQVPTTQGLVKPRSYTPRGEIV